MAKREIAAQYVGSFLGFVWTFIKPLVMICVFWFVFSVGFKSMPMGNIPFVVWLAAGLAPWFCFADIVTSSAVVVVGNSHLVKKTLFPSQILPIIKLLSGLITHAVFLSILFGLLISQKVPLSFYSLQFVYYLLCFSLLALGISWLVSALHVFVRDTAQIVAVVLQVGFWGTPIFWDIKMMPPSIQFWLKFNPFYYVVQGYRESFLEFVPFWHHTLHTLYFWAITLFILLAGAYVFRKLKPQFADVL
ncbi:ABC transporter permease [Desulfofustis limnaeus]|uniref:Transport permease protein n=1 Tax=Desulfofustis limnaeus TaxID=2740163 RepID=A0ABM7WDU7_9BACT|nr:ABC transporter permease [Desulfofustis limnaeus]BDD89127.1 transport permease protein [Desulfofustis limnaeus]